MIYIVGVVGVPGKYGGFETLVDYLLDSKRLTDAGVVVFCEASIAQDENYEYKGASLEPISFKANGWQSVIFDLIGILTASLRKADKILILGTSATFVIPFVKFFFPRTIYIVNMAGLEWSRSKWGPLSRWFLKFNEMVAAKFSHVLITDNQGLQDYVFDAYSQKSVLIAYGGDQFLDAVADLGVFYDSSLPESFDFSMARAQSDNNMEVILEAYIKSGRDLVFVSNWRSSSFGQKMLRKYGQISNLYLIGPIYDVGKIKALYQNARIYVHGHSAGGTNPVLVESMWARLPILAFDVSFNRHTTKNGAFYFNSTDELVDLTSTLTTEALTNCAERLFRSAADHYTWGFILKSYELLLLDEDF